MIYILAGDEVHACETPEALAELMGWSFSAAAQVFAQTPDGAMPTEITHHTSSVSVGRGVRESRGPDVVVVGAWEMVEL